MEPFEVLCLVVGICLGAVIRAPRAALQPIGWFLIGALCGVGVTVFICVLIALTTAYVTGYSTLLGLFLRHPMGIIPT
jgi:uncharacterized membrane protein